LGNLLTLEVFLEEISHHEDSVIELSLRPLVIVTLLKVINLNENVSLRKLGCPVSIGFRKCFNQFDL